MFRLPLRYQLGLTLVVVNVLLTAGVALSRTARRTTRWSTRPCAPCRSSRRAASARLADMLEHRQERLVGFLQSLRSLCGETRPDRTASAGKMSASAPRLGDFTGASAHCRRTCPTAGGRWDAQVRSSGSPAPLPGQLVRIVAVAGAGQLLDGGQPRRPVGPVGVRSGRRERNLRGQGRARVQAAKRSSPTPTAIGSRPRVGHAHRSTRFSCRRCRNVHPRCRSGDAGDRRPWCQCHRRPASRGRRSAAAASSPT